MRYKLLGKSGLRVSELCLGTMAFGDDWGWGSGIDDSRKIFDAIAKLRGWTEFVGIQVEYSLIERTCERELLPMARELDLASVEFLLDEEHLSKLETASCTEAGFPHGFFANEMVQNFAFGGMRDRIDNHRSA
jgi:aryl-alcohol dehydrogenase-like predicted oxidoreductase